ncbi:MAG: DAK2 domain-containing protein [Gaiellaceae bacterium]|jgi:dihydroxyacetone kinase-like protein
MSDATLTTTQQAVLSAADALESARDELCRLDAVAGDGDHGLTMAAAARAIRSEIEHRAPADLGELTALVASQFSAVGGSMGALSYVLVEAVGNAVSAEDAPLSAAQLARLLAAAEDAVSGFGGAKRGDKTIIDAIAPAREAAEQCACQQRPPAEALLASAAAAEKGAASTAELIARIGRASRLGERSLGAVDAGATSFAIVLRALARSYAEET